MSKTPFLHRREFLELAALGSAALVAPQASVGGANAARTAFPKHARLHSLAPGAVKPEGWLRLYLQKQAQQLASHLPAVSSPFTESYWAGEEATSANGWWPWEQRAYWVDGALRCALVLKDEGLLRQALGPVDYTLTHVMPDGYLGPAYLRDPKARKQPSGDFRWPHNVFFRALAAQGEATHDPGIAAAMRRHYLADRNHSFYQGPSLNITNIEGMLVSAM